MSEQKTSLIAPFILLGLAALLLAGCTLENEPAAERKDPKPIALDKLEKEQREQAKDTPPAPPVPQNTPTPQPSTPMIKKQYNAPPALIIDASKQYTAVLRTEKGDITIALDAKQAPKTVNNFVFLAREKFYDNTIFHRTIPGFMIQGGDPEGTGRGGPGYRFDDEPVAGEYTRGTVAMANAGPDTNGSQFFIMHADYALPPNYVIFGQVTAGLETVDAIATAPTKPGGEGSSPVSPVSVASVDIVEE